MSATSASRIWCSGYEERSEAWEGKEGVILLWQGGSHGRGREAGHRCVLHLLPINLPTCIWNGRMRSYMILMRSPILETGLKPVRSCLWKQDKCISTWYDVRQRSQPRLYLRHSTSVLGNECAIYVEPLRRHRQRARDSTRRLDIQLHPQTRALPL